MKSLIHKCTCFALFGQRNHLHGKDTTFQTNTSILYPRVSSTYFACFLSEAVFSLASRKKYALGFRYSFYSRSPGLVCTVTLFSVQYIYSGWYCLLKSLPSALGVRKPCLLMISRENPMLLQNCNRIKQDHSDNEDDNLTNIGRP